MYVFLYLFMISPVTGYSYGATNNVRAGQPVTLSH